VREKEEEVEEGTEEERGEEDDLGRVLLSPPDETPTLQPLLSLLFLLLHRHPSLFVTRTTTHLPPYRSLLILPITTIPPQHIPMLLLLPFTRRSPPPPSLPPPPPPTSFHGTTITGGEGGDLGRGRGAGREGGRNIEEHGEDTLPLWCMTHLTMAAGKEEEEEGRERGRGIGTGEEEEEKEERRGVGRMRGMPFPPRLFLCLRTMEEVGGGKEGGGV